MFNFQCSNSSLYILQSIIWFFLLHNNSRVLNYIRKSLMWEYRPLSPKYVILIRLNFGWHSNHTRKQPSSLHIGFTNSFCRLYFRSLVSIANCLSIWIAHNSAVFMSIYVSYCAPFQIVWVLWFPNSIFSCFFFLYIYDAFKGHRWQLMTVLFNRWRQFLSVRSVFVNRL